MTKEIKANSPVNSIKISSLVNSVYYFLNWVYIVENQSEYRLIVAHKKEILYNNSYKTLKGARIAFSRLFKNRRWKGEFKTEWSFFYEPESKWLIRHSSLIDF